MELKELIIELGVENLAPFHFVDNLEDREYAKCKHMSDEELKDYNNGVHDKNKIYNESELGIYLINTNIDNLYNMAIESNPYFVKSMINEISYYIKVDFKYKSIIYATYTILHEVGHWINFKKTNMSSLEYSIWDAKYRRKVNKFFNGVREMNDDDPFKYIYADEYNEMYKNIPSEKEANEFTLNNIKDYLSKIGIPI
ncbi:hypothetical protein ACQPUZ_16420 [Clostridium tertium]